MFNNLYRKVRNLVMSQPPLWQIYESKVLPAGLHLSVITFDHHAAERLEAARRAAQGECAQMLREERDKFLGSEVFANARAARTRADDEFRKLERLERAAESAHSLYCSALLEDSPSASEIRRERDEARSQIDPTREAAGILAKRAELKERVAVIELARHLRAALHAFQKSAGEAEAETLLALPGAIESAALEYLVALARRGGAGYDGNLADSLIAEIDPRTAPIAPDALMKARTPLKIHGASGVESRLLQVGETFRAADVPVPLALVQNGAAERAG